MKRIDKRKAGELRKMKVKQGYLKFADGSCLIEWGNTKVVCSATLEGKVPPFLRGKGVGWLTAEYGMLPASCSKRIVRESARGKVSGRTQEIQRLIGRCLRSVVNRKIMGEKTIVIDCDVLQGDGGTRTASITGAFIALGELVEKKVKEGVLPKALIKDYIAAVSIGIRDKVVLTDLCYEEDSTADVDMNVVMTGSGKLIEVQGTAEGEPFSIAEMDKMIAAARKGIMELVEVQKKFVRI